jgi:hypothetical protein
MIVVFVGEQNGIEVAYLCAQHLLAQIRTGIDENICVAVLKQGRGAQPFVPRINGSANLAFASDDGYAL